MSTFVKQQRRSIVHVTFLIVFVNLKSTNSENSVTKYTTTIRPDYISEHLSNILQLKAPERLSRDRDKLKKLQNANCTKTIILHPQNLKLANDSFLEPSAVFRVFDASTEGLSQLLGVANSNTDRCDVLTLSNSQPVQRMQNEFYPENKYYYGSPSENVLPCSSSTSLHEFINAISFYLYYLPHKSTIAIVDDGTGCGKKASRLLELKIKSNISWYSTGVQVFSAVTDSNAKYSSVIRILRHMQLLVGKRHIYVLLTPYWLVKAFLESHAFFHLETRMNHWIVPHTKFERNLYPKLITKHIHTYKLIDNLNSTTISQFISTVSDERRDARSLMDITESLFSFWSHGRWVDTHKKAHGLESLVEVSYASVHTKTLRNYGIRNLRVTTVLEGPFTTEIPRLYDKLTRTCHQTCLVCRKWNSTAQLWENTCCMGYSIDLLIMLMKLLDFQVDLYIVADGKYGGRNTDGSWNGMIREVIDGSADIAVQGITINEERSKVVDFTEPFMLSELGIATKEMADPSQNRGIHVSFRIFENFTVEMGLLVLCLIPVAVICVYILENLTFYSKSAVSDNKVKSSIRKSIRLQQDKMRDNRKPSAAVRAIRAEELLNKTIPTPRKRYSMKEAFSYIASLAWQRDIGGKNPKTKGGRVMSVCYAFFMVISTTLYTASLTASNVTNDNKIKFFGLNDPKMRNPTTAFRYGTTGATSIEAFFRNAPDEILNRMYHFMLNYNTGLISGLQRIMDGQLEAYIYEKPYLSHVIAVDFDCQLSLFDGGKGEQYYGLAMNKSSILKDIFSKGLLSLREDETLLKLERKWLYSACGSNQQSSLKHNMEQFSSAHFSGAYLIMGLTVPVCLLISCVAWLLELRKRYTSASFDVNLSQQLQDSVYQSGRYNTGYIPDHDKSCDSTNFNGYIFDQLRKMTNTSTCNAKEENGIGEPSLKAVTNRRSSIYNQHETIKNRVRVYSEILSANDIERVTIDVHVHRNRTECKESVFTETASY